MVLVFSQLTVKIRGRRQNASVGCCGCNGTGIHESHGGNLSVLQLASLPVREVSGGMADTEGIVGRRIPGSEAGAAEGRLHHCAGLQDGCRTAVADQLHIHGHGRRVNAQSKSARADAFTFQNICRRADILKTASCTAGNDPLIHHKFSVFHLILQLKLCGAVQAHLSALFCFLQDIHEIFVQLLNSYGVAGMEGHGDHGTDPGKIHHDHSVIIGCLSGFQLLICIRPPMNLIKITDGVIRLPYRRKTGGLGGHHINADPEVRA